MGQLFAMDGKVNNFLRRVSDLVILNLLWLVCCLPVVTIGAATTALYRVTIEMARNEESYIVSVFFEALKENFKQATRIWIGVLAAGIILYFDFYAVNRVGGIVGMILAAGVLLTAILIGMTVCYVFPILACFQNRTLHAVKNAVLMSVAHLPYTLLIMLLSCGPIFLIFIMSENLILAGFIDVVLGEALFALLNAHLFQRIFKRYGY